MNRLQWTYANRQVIDTMKHIGTAVISDVTITENIEVDRISAADNTVSTNTPKTTDYAGEISVTQISSMGEVLAISAEWAQLAERTDIRNPFVHPDWLIAWAERFIRSNEQICFLVARHRGHLVGVAPFYRRSWGGGMFHSMQLWGTGRQSRLVEIPQLLLDAEQPRTVARAFVNHLSSQTGKWDWAEVPLQEGLWLEPDWLPQGGLVTVLLKTVRPSVVLSIIDGSAPRMKRNLRESLRRSRNRLNRSFPEEWSVARADDGPELLKALSDLARLHGERSQLGGKKQHPDALSDEAVRSFVSAGVAKMAERSGASIYRLIIKEQAVAALLVLHTAACTYVLISGVDPAYWEFSPVTLLQSRAIEDAVSMGCDTVNLSTGPDTAKLRWSEKLAMNAEFVLVPDRRFSRAAFGAYWQASAALQIKRERGRHKFLSNGQI